MKRQFDNRFGGSASASVDPTTAVPLARVRRQVSLPVQLASGSTSPAELFTFHNLADGREHVALGLGDYIRRKPPLVRLHSECLTGDVFGSARCDCGHQLDESVQRISAVGGYLLYLRQEGRGIGLYNKVDAYALQDLGQDTFEANRSLGFANDERHYVAAHQMLCALDIRCIDLLTNNPDKVSQLRQLGTTVRSVCRTNVHVTRDNENYLRVKADQASHTLAPGRTTVIP